MRPHSTRRTLVSVSVRVPSDLADTLQRLTPPLGSMSETVRILLQRAVDAEAHNQLTAELLGHLLAEFQKQIRTHFRVVLRTALLNVAGCSPEHVESALTKLESEDRL